MTLLLFDRAEYAEAKEKIPFTVPSKNVTFAEGMVLTNLILFNHVGNARVRDGLNTNMVN